MNIIPVDIINYICEIAAGRNKCWYPNFSPKTHKLSWKVNPYSTKYIQLSRKLLNKIRFVSLTFLNIKTHEEGTILCRAILFKELNTYINKVYIEYKLDEGSDENFMLRAMLNIYNYYSRNSDTMLYLNGTPYASIEFGRAELHYWPTNFPNVNEKITIAYETY